MSSTSSSRIARTYKCTYVLMCGNVRVEMCSVYLDFLRLHVLDFNLENCASLCVYIHINMRDIHMCRHV